MLLSLMITSLCMYISLSDIVVKSQLSFQKCYLFFLNETKEQGKIYDISRNCRWLLITVLRINVFCSQQLRFDIFLDFSLLTPSACWCRWPSFHLWCCQASVLVGHHICHLLLAGFSFVKGHLSIRFCLYSPFNIHI